jgi:hypothetical protein
MRRVTVAVRIAADGTVLPSTIVFKGKPDGWIARKEFGTYPTTHHYHCQDSAWMDERVLLAWVDEVSNRTLPTHRSMSSPSSSSTATAAT